MSHPNISESPPKINVKITSQEELENTDSSTTIDQNSTNENDAKSPRILQFNTSSESLAEFGKKIDLRDSVILNGQSAFDTLEKDHNSKAISETNEPQILTNTGNTKTVMNLLSEMWIIHIAFILGFTYYMTFVLQQDYNDDDIWNMSCWWKIGNLYSINLRMDFTTSLHFNLLYFFSSTVSNNKISCA